MRSALAPLGAALMAAVGCGREMSVETTVEVPSIEDVRPEQWQALASRRLFFGHQSVGGNIIEGVQELLAARRDIALEVIEASDPARMSAPGLYHAWIGENGLPHTKLDAFESIVAKVSIASPEVAMVKFCYLDVTPGADPAALFQDYRRTIDQIREANPELIVVHVTMPLTTDPGWLRHLGQAVRRKFSLREQNHIRDRYNELLRSAYAGREPLFDLARFEAIGQDGWTRAVGYRGRQVPILASEWTDDGGHLNEAGRRRMAEAFLATLATLP